MIHILKLSDKEFKAAILKLLHQAINQMPKTNEKKIESQKRKRRYKEKTNEKF